MRFYLTLFLLIFMPVISSCHSIAGADNDLTAFDMEHSGIATITRIYTLHTDNFIEYLWKADNNLSEPTTVSTLPILKIDGINPLRDFKIGEKLPLTVIHFFNQHGSKAPVLIRSNWSLRETSSLSEPDLLKLLYMKRPARCVNQ